MGNVEVAGMALVGPSPFFFLEIGVDLRAILLHLARMESVSISSTPMTIPARDGFALSAKVYGTQIKGSSVILIGSAMGVKQAYYRRFAQFLAQYDFTVITFDYRGIGGSRPASLKGFSAQLHQWGTDDLAGVIDWVQDTLAPSHLLYVGHSVGGQILGLAPNSTAFDGLYLVAVQHGCWRFWPGWRKWGIALFWYFFLPVAHTVFGYFPGWLMGQAEDLPKGIVQEWAMWGRDPQYVLSHSSTAADGFTKLTAPLHLEHFSDDPLAPPRAAEAVLAWYPNAQKTHRCVKPEQVKVDRIGHFGFFRPVFSKTLWMDVLAWLQTRRQET